VKGETGGSGKGEKWKVERRNGGQQKIGKRKNRESRKKKQAEGRNGGGGKAENFG
jgi:hypothetical protein